jgi:hypothetical protein
MDLHHSAWSTLYDPAQKEPPGSPVLSSAYRMQGDNLPEPLAVMLIAGK